jgi:hypothetical protein
MSVEKYPGYDALAPFFAIIMEGVNELIDGEHFFDILSDDIVWEYPYALPGTFPELVGRIPNR